jgi:hypothetical protein
MSPAVFAMSGPGAIADRPPDVAGVCRDGTAASWGRLTNQRSADMRGSLVPAGLELSQR